MKKISYTNKSAEELRSELSTLRHTLYDTVTKSQKGKNSATYHQTRKNIARVQTAINAPGLADSTKLEK